jgi:WD40 repeat protein/serine/threonine protein kinase
MADIPPEKDRLFGVMAAKLGFTSEADAEAYAQTFVRDPGMTLADRWEKEGVLEPEQRKLVDAMVDQAVSVNEGNFEKTLRALGVRRELDEALAEDADGREDISAGISFEHVGRYRYGDPNHTVSERGAKKKLFPVDPRAPREIGRGGIGRVLIAYDGHLGREIAVKELLPHLLKSEPDSRSTDSKAIVGRFLREARVTAQLEHPNIVPVYELGKRKDGTLYYTMKLVRGRTLSDALKSTHDLSDRLKLLNHFVGLCQAIAYAHSRGVVHRDIKPQNVMVGEFGETLVLDWGLAKIRGKKDIRGQDLLREVQQLREGEAVSTVPGSAFGTPAYMSPEQAEGQLELIDERSDVWGLGVVLYEILTGRLPFQGPNALAVVVRVMKEQPARVLSVYPEAPVELAAVADRALRRDRSERYQTAKELADEIVSFQSGGRVEAHQYTPLQLLKRFIESQKQKLAIAAVAFACLVAVAFGAYVQVLGERDRALRAEEESKKSLADALTERARTAALARDFMAAELYAGEALAIDESPVARGLVIGLDGVWRPKLLFETVTWAACHRVALAPDGSLIACATTDEVALFPREGRGEAGRHLRTPGGFNLSAVFSPDGSVLAAGGEDGNVRIFDLAGDSLKFTLLIGAAVHALTFSPDGTRLAAAGNEDAICIFDTSTYGEILKISVGKAAVAALAYSSDGRLLAVGGKDQVVRVLEAGSGTEKIQFRAHEKEVTSLAFSPDAELLVSGSIDRSARAFDLKLGRAGLVFAGHDDEVRAVSFTADSRFLLTASADKLVRVFGRTSARTIARIDGDDPLVSIAISKDGNTLVSSGVNRTLRVFDISTAAPPPPKRDQRSPVSTLSIASDGLSVATGADDGVIRVFESTNGKKARLFKGHTSEVTGLDFSPDGTLLASGGADQKIFVWLMSDGRALGTFSVPAPVRSLVFLGDGKTVVAATGDATLRFFGEGEKREEAVGAPITALAHEPRCPLLAISTEEKKVLLIRADTRAAAGELPAQTDRIAALAMSPKCDLLAIASGDYVVLHELESKALRGRFPKGDGPVAALAFSPDGKRLAWGGKDKLVRIGGVVDLKEHARLEAHTAEISALDWAIGGKYLASGSEDRTLRFFNLANLDTPGTKLSARAGEDFGMRLVAGKISFEHRGRRP